MALLPVRRKERERGSLARFHDEVDDLFRGFFEDWDWPVWSRGHRPRLKATVTRN